MPQSLSHHQGPIPSSSINRIIRDKRSSGGNVVEGEVGGVDVVVGRRHPLWTLIDRVQ